MCSYSVYKCLLGIGLSTCSGCVLAVNNATNRYLFTVYFQRRSTDVCYFLAFIQMHTSSDPIYRCLCKCICPTICTESSLYRVTEASRYFNVTARVEQAVSRCSLHLMNSLISDTSNKHNFPYGYFMVACKLTVTIALFLCSAYMSVRDSRPTFIAFVAFWTCRCFLIMISCRQQWTIACYAYWRTNKQTHKYWWCVQRAISGWPVILRFCPRFCSLSPMYWALHGPPTSCLRTNCSVHYRKIKVGLVQQETGAMSTTGSS